MKILLAVDGSAASLRAAKRAINLATALLERPLIVPLHVHRPLPNFRGIHRVISEKDIQRYYREESEKAVKAAMKILSGAGYAAAAEFRVGPVAETIVSFAAQRKFDLICLGSRGMTPASGLVLGSVTSKVLHLSKIPVLVIT